MRSQTGAIKFSTLVWIGLLAGLVYSLVKLVPPYVRDFQISSTLATATKFYAEKNKRDTVSVYLQKKVREMELPVTPEDFVFAEENGEVLGTIEWSADVVWIPENPLVEEHRRVLTFYHEATEKLK